MLSRDYSVNNKLGKLCHLGRALRSGLVRAVKHSVSQSIAAGIVACLVESESAQMANTGNWVHNPKNSLRRKAAPRAATPSVPITKATLSGHVPFAGRTIVT